MNTVQLDKPIPRAAVSAVKLSRVLAEYVALDDAGNQVVQRSFWCEDRLSPEALAELEALATADVKAANLV